MARDERVVRIRGLRAPGLPKVSFGEVDLYLGHFSPSEDEQGAYVIVTDEIDAAHFPDPEAALAECERVKAYGLDLRIEPCSCSDDTVPAAG